LRRLADRDAAQLIAIVIADAPLGLQVANASSGQHSVTTPGVSSRAPGRMTVTVAPTCEAVQQILRAFKANPLLAGLCYGEHRLAGADVLADARRRSR